MACVAAAAAVAGWLFWPEDLFYPRLTTAAQAPPVSISVGENIHVSTPHAGIKFTECVIAADPQDERRLFAASMYWPDIRGTSLVGYLSEDGGASWKTSLNLVADRTGKEERLTDPTVAFGPGGEIYLVHMRMDDAKLRSMGPASIGRPGAATLDWLCLPRGAASWELRGRIDRHIDRPWIAVDPTQGPHRGELYCAANISTPMLITSEDGGRTFKFPTVPYRQDVTAYPAQPVVLSDGSAVMADRCYRNKQFVWQPEQYPTFISTDGGATVKLDSELGHWKVPHLIPNLQTTEGFFPQLAVDPGSPRFADRLYLVWSQRFDNRRSTEWILLSRSDDRGKTWSVPVKLSEQPEGVAAAGDYISYLPCVAVNKEGVVAVTWYDRRGLAPGNQPGLKGWNVRMRVSLDGGSTWPPSVQITSRPSTGELTGWHTAGLCADAAGRFHPLWIDDRTGIPQLWTATVAVEPPPSPATQPASARQHSTDHQPPAPPASVPSGGTG